MFDFSALSSSIQNLVSHPWLAAVALLSLIIAGVLYGGFIGHWIETPGQGWRRFIRAVLSDPFWFRLPLVGLALMILFSAFSIPSGVGLRAAGFTALIGVCGWYLLRLFRRRHCRPE